MTVKLFIFYIYNNLRLQKYHRNFHAVYTKNLFLIFWPGNIRLQNCEFISFCWVTEDTLLIAYSDNSIFKSNTFNQTYLRFLEHKSRFIQKLYSVVFFMAIKFTNILAAYMCLL